MAEPVNESSSTDMYGLIECMSSGCVAQKGEHAKISCQLIHGWDRILADHLNK